MASCMSARRSSSTAIAFDPQRIVCRIGSRQKIECLLPTLQNRRAFAWRQRNWIRFLSGVIGGKIAV